MKGSKEFVCGVGDFNFLELKTSILNATLRKPIPLQAGSKIFITSRPLHAAIFSTLFILLYRNCRLRAALNAHSSFVFSFFFFFFHFCFLTFIVASIMPGILVPLMLIMLYQQAQTQRKIHWGKRLCDQVRPFLVGEKGDVYKPSGNGCSKHGYP